MHVKLIQPENAPSEMSVMKSGMVNSVTVLSFTPVIVQVVAVEAKMNGASSSDSAIFHFA